MSRRAFLIAALAVAACRGGDRAQEKRVAPAVPGIETGVAATDTVRDVVLAFGAVAADQEPTEVRDARTQLAQAEAKRELARRQVRRLEDLAGAVAPMRELEAARADEATAAAEAARAEKALAAFGRDRERTPLAPEETWVIAHLPQRDVTRVEAGADARFTADALPGTPLAGSVDAAPAYVDPTTRTAPVRVRVRDPGRQLRPGMTGSVAVEVGAPHEAVVVPAAAVVYDDAEPVVFVEEGDGRYGMRAVRLGAVRDGRIEIASGLAPGARVVVAGAASLLSAHRLPAQGGEE
jgi:Cu(I)/Ag(I) efflux system membrane fusion protein